MVFVLFGYRKHNCFVLIRARNETVLNDINLEISGLHTTIIKHDIHILLLPKAFVHFIPDGIFAEMKMCSLLQVLLLKTSMIAKMNSKNHDWSLLITIFHTIYESMDHTYYHKML